MGILYYKDEFGYKKFRGGLFMKISFTLTAILLVGYVFTGIMANSCAVPDTRKSIHKEPEELEFEFDEHEPVLEWDIPDPTIQEPTVITHASKQIPDKADNSKPVPAQKKFVKYIWRLEYRFSRIRYTTCYTGYDKNDPGHGKYANQKYASKLHLYERRIRYEHNTVALCPEDKIYHQQLIQMSDGIWTHKWRVHIHGVHRDQICEATDSGYFGVPRDRMKQSGRIDYLITQAGKYKDMEQRVKNWKSMNRKVDFWEWTRYALYSDGSRERVE